MYFIAYTTGNNKIAVCDTTDGCIEFLSKEEYQRYIQAGVIIEPWDSVKYNITSAIVSRSNYKLYNKLTRALSGADVVEYLQENVVYELVELFQMRGAYPVFEDLKVYDFTETEGYFVVLVWLGTGERVVMRVEKDNIVTRLAPRWFDVNKYPCGSGLLYNKLIDRYKLGAPTLGLEYVYVLLYSKDKKTIALLNIDRLETVACIDAELANPQGVILQ